MEGANISHCCFSFTGPSGATLHNFSPRKKKNQFLKKKTIWPCVCSLLHKHSDLTSCQSCSLKTELHCHKNPPGHFHHSDDSLLFFFLQHSDQVFRITPSDEKKVHMLKKILGNMKVGFLCSSFFLLMSGCSEVSAIRTTGAVECGYLSQSGLFLSG